MFDQPEESELEIAVEAEEAGSETDSVEAEIVHVEQSSVMEVKADKVELHQSSAAKVEAQSLTAYQSALALTQAQNVHLNGSSVALVRTMNFAAEDSVVTAVLADSVTLGTGASVLVAAREVSGESIKTSLLLAGHVHGPVETVLDTPRALLAGLSAGVAVGLVLWLGSLLSRRRSG